MSISTRDRHKLGTTTFQTTIAYDNGDDIYHRHFADCPEFPTEAEAFAHVERILPTLTNDDAEHPGWWGRVDRGTYVADDFADDEYGTVHDVSWEIDQDFYAVVNMVDGSIEWDRDDR